MRAAPPGRFLWGGGDGEDSRRLRDFLLVSGSPGGDVLLFSFKSAIVAAVSTA